MATKVVALLVALSLSSCVVSYRRFPREKVGAPAPAKVYDKLYFHVDGLSVAGGHLALWDAMKGKSPFKEVETAEQPPAQGLFVDARIANIPPSVTSVAFAIVSYTTLTLLPVYTGRGGSNLYYDVYVDGQKVKTFDYQVRRKGAIWFFLLPFIWTNIFTYSEAEAFDAATLKFFEDAEPLFRTAFTPAP